MGRASSELGKLLEEFVDELNRGDGDAAGRRFTSADELLVIGTSSGEWLEGPKLAVDAFRVEAGTLRADFDQVNTYQDGPFGWIAARGHMTLQDGRALPVRWTLVLQRGADQWEILHSHLSVPDDLEH
jgi:hypothetical protein